MNNVWAKENCAKCGCLLDDDFNCTECEICNTVIITGDTTFDHSDTDMVNSPPHYNTVGIECIEAMKAMSHGAHLPSSHAHYCWQNAFKYIWRHPYKGTALEDLKKCEYYLKRLINEYDENGK
tara:strand:- start:143 stop:511 length:369 start_codon:yes stop_codon:yes gene_type:complete